MSAKQGSSSRYYHRCWHSQSMLGNLQHAPKENWVATMKQQSRLHKGCRQGLSTCRRDPWPFDCKCTQQSCYSLTTNKPGGRKPGFHDNAPLLRITHSLSQSHILSQSHTLSKTHSLSLSNTLQLSQHTPGSTTNKPLYPHKLALDQQTHLTCFTVSKTSHRTMCGKR